MLYRNLLALLAAVVLLAGPARAQGDDPRFIDPFLLSTQGHTFPALSGTGLSTTFDVPVADLGAVNPAALGASDHPEIGLTYGLATSISGGYLFDDVDYDADNGVRPQSAAVVVPVGAFRLGASYAQRYAGRLDFGTIFFTTPESREVEQEGPSFEMSARVETFSPQAAYRAESAFAEGDVFTAGLRVGIGRAEFEERIDTLGAAFSDWGTQVAAGVSYQAATARPLSLGLYYESPLRFEATTTRTIPLLIGPFGEETDEVITMPVRYEDALPGRLGLSLRYAPTPTVRVGADVVWVFWEDAREDWRSQFDASAHAQLDVSNDALVSFGVFAQGRSTFSEEIADIFGYSGRAIYLTAGGALHLGRFRLDAVVADSHLLAAEEHRQTVVKMGTSVRF